MLRRTFAFLQAARVLSTSATQGGASFLDAAGAGLLTAGERLQRAADGLPFRCGLRFRGICMQSWSSVYCPERRQRATDGLPFRWVPPAL
jgi:hypothetical protein